MFLKEVSYAWFDHRYIKKQKYCEILLQFKITDFIYLYFKLLFINIIFQDSLMNIKFLFEKEIFCYTLIVLTVTFHSFNVSLLNKTIIFFQ